MKNKVYTHSFLHFMHSRFQSTNVCFAVHSICRGYIADNTMLPFTEMRGSFLSINQPPSRAYFNLNSPTTIIILTSFLLRTSISSYYPDDDGDDDAYSILSNGIQDSTLGETFSRRGISTVCLLAMTGHDTTRQSDTRYLSSAYGYREICFSSISFSLLQRADANDTLKKTKGSPLLFRSFRDEYEKHKSFFPFFLIL